MVDGLNDLMLMIMDFSSADEGTFVCRTENIAGRDADVVSLIIGERLVTVSCQPSKSQFITL